MTGSCTICAQLQDEEYGYQKYGRDEDDLFLPEAASRLVTLKDFKPNSSRKLLLQQCPECGAYYLYTSDYEYLVNGTEDEEFLRRLTAADAAEYLDRPAPEHSVF